MAISAAAKSNHDQLFGTLNGLAALNDITRS